MPLSDLQIKNAKPKEKRYKLYDERSMFLVVDPSGGKWWRFKYDLGQGERGISLGVYPDVSLADARDLRDEKRKLVAKGIDPSAARKAEKLARAGRAKDSFEVIAREWLQAFIDPMSESHRKRVYARFENDLFPRISGRLLMYLFAVQKTIVRTRFSSRCRSAGGLPGNLYRREY